MRFLLLTLVSLSSLLVVASYSNVKMACLVNSERSKRGLQALGIDSRLTQAAQAHSNDQARMRQMTHTGSDGSDPGKRCTRAGFQWNAVAENVAYGYKDETSCMAQWMQSPGHRQNILGNYQMFGSAVANAGSTPYYTQDFGTDKQGRRNVPKCNGQDSEDSYPDKSGGGDAGDDMTSYGGGSNGNNGGGKKGRGGKVKSQGMKKSGGGNNNYSGNDNSFGGNDDFFGGNDDFFGGNDNSYGGGMTSKKGRGKWNKGGKKSFGGDNDDFFGNDDDSFGGNKKFKSFFGGKNFGGKNFGGNSYGGNNFKGKNFGDGGFGKMNFGGHNFGKGFNNY